MGMTERQKALIRIGTAYVNGETPASVDVEYVKGAKRGRPKEDEGESLEQFKIKISLAWCYIYARNKKGLSPDESLADAIEAWDDHKYIGMDSLKAFRSYLRSEKVPDDPQRRYILEHTRAALAQIDKKYGDAFRKKIREDHRKKWEEVEKNDSEG